MLGHVTWLLVFAGSAALSWSAVQVAGAYVYQRAARHTLAVTQPSAAIAPGFDPRSSRAHDVVSGAPLAALSIPRLNLSAVVLHGSDAQTLRRGLGHIEQTAMPGEVGNVGIAGHRDTFFRALRHIRTGDEILLETPWTQWRYTVSSLRVVGPREVAVLNPTTDATLTLVTCHPFGLLGPAPDRFVVRATRTTDSQSTAAAAQTPAAAHDEPTRTASQW